ncbi:MAG: hypothetical protein QOD71_3328 [Thermoleophilaceae bacterium]|nr:hypothetical protein [Thermoleophilaceae bacterium]
MVVGLVALVAVTLFGPPLAVAAAWVVAALALAGAGLGSSPAIELRGRVNSLDGGDRRQPPDDEV